MSNNTSTLNTRLNTATYRKFQRLKVKNPHLTVRYVLETAIEQLWSLATETPVEDNDIVQQPSVIPQPTKSVYCESDLKAAARRMMEQMQRGVDYDTEKEVEKKIVTVDISSSQHVVDGIDVWTTIPNVPKKWNDNQLNVYNKLLSDLKRQYDVNIVEDLAKGHSLEDVQAYF